jgi:hypothetical protein
MKEFVKRILRHGLRKAASASGIRERLGDINQALDDIQDRLAGQQQQVAGVQHQLQLQLAGLQHQLQGLQQQLADVQQRCATELAGASKAAQVLLSLKYQELIGQRRPLPTFDDVEFRCFSQTSEDGILLYLFSLLGTTNKRCVEVCAGDGTECNTANLIINHGWRGLLFDGNEALIARGKEFYARCRDTFIAPPTLVASWITADNINSLIAEHGFKGEIDLFSLDVDGVDYWIWKALDCIQPRIVVVEFQAYWGPEKAVTVPYREDFSYDFSQQPYYYLGASLPAFVKLGKQKGYRLVGVHRIGFNAFFVRDGVGEDVLPEVSVAECFARHRRLREWTPAWIPDMEGRGWVWEEV